jgi:hypothetical protein
MYDRQLFRLTDTQKQCLRLFVENKVALLLVGGFAVRFHGGHRQTSDLDLLVGTSRENADAICACLSKLGSEKIDEARRYLQAGWKKIDWHDVDLLTSIHGGVFDDFVKRASIGVLLNSPISVLSRSDLINERKMSLQDLKQVGRHKLIARDLNCLQRDRDNANPSIQRDR